MAPHLPRQSGSMVLQWGGSRNPEPKPGPTCKKLGVTSGAAILRCAGYVADDIAQFSGGACGDDVTGVALRIL